MQEFKDQNSQQDKIMFQAEATASPFQSLLCRFKMPHSMLQVQILGSSAWYY